MRFARRGVPAPCRWRRRHTSRGRHPVLWRKRFSCHSLVCCGCRRRGNTWPGRLSRRASVALRGARILLLRRINHRAAAKSSIVICFRGDGQRGAHAPWQGGDGCPAAFRVSLQRTRPPGKKGRGRLDHARSIPPWEENGGITRGREGVPSSTADITMLAYCSAARQLHFAMPGIENYDPCANLQIVSTYTRHEDTYTLGRRCSIYR